MLRFLNSGSAKNSARVTVDIPIGPYAFLLLAVEGTTDVGQTLAAADVGNVRIIREGREIQGETYEFYHDITDLKGGFPAATLPTAGASRIVAVIPFSVPGIANVLDVRSKEELDVVLEFNDVLDTRFGANAATYSLYGFVTDALYERYELIVQQQDLQSAAAGRLEDTVNGINVAALYLVDTANVVDKLQVTADGRTVVDNLDDAVLLDITNLRNRIESAQNLIEIDFAPGHSIPETQNRSVQMSVQFNAAGTLQVTAFRVMPSRTVQSSIARQAAFLASKGYSGVQAPRSLPQGALVRG